MAAICCGALVCHKWLLSCTVSQARWTQIILASIRASHSDTSQLAVFEHRTKNLPVMLDLRAYPSDTSVMAVFEDYTRALPMMLTLRACHSHTCVMAVFEYQTRDLPVMLDADEE